MIKPLESGGPETVFGLTSNSLDVLLLPTLVG